MPVPAYDLTGRSILVTGAASGIGRATALLLAQAGATVHCADLDEKGLDETVAQAGPTAHAHPLDVTDRAQVRKAVQAAAPLHGLVAAAGIMHRSTVVDTDDADLDRLWAVNFKGVLHACQEATLAMTEQQTGGSLVTLASGAVDSGTPQLLCYSVAKAAIVQLTRTLAAEAGPHGIRVNAIAPGWIRTPMTTRDTAEAQAHTEKLMARMSPLGRVGAPEDVAHAALYLLSDAAAFTTGQILRPNGGVAMPW
ncbi:SDR family oxidoreductase [Streptomyces sp. A7024]|uniref:SDR family oxidoreductase n=1 Tax=Streptomyces coryli TaxID=1128680 RepID=A0A6G4U798_9ACTN|nr:SDR family oxidoreductase [Streptomyces coryli]NGN67586.1 SDR family oxidoreductase [Streptomyces coryli]